MRRRRPGRGHGRRARELSELRVRVQPRGRRDEIAGERDGRILVRVTAPPLEGRANEAVRKLIAKRLGIAKSKVTVVRGERSRDKTVRVEGVSAASARRSLLG